MQNHGYLEMISPPWPQNRPNCQGVSKNLAQTTGKSFSRWSNSPSLKADIEETPLTSINPLGIPTLLNLSQITKGLVQKTGFFVPLPRRDISQTPRVHSVLENPNMGSADSPNCFRLQYKFLKTPFQNSPPFIQTSGQEALLISQEVNELLQKGAIQKTPFTRDSVLTAACFLYSEREDLCIRWYVLGTSSL